MGAAEIVLRALLALVGLGYILHYHLMANHANRTPLPIKMLIYPTITASGVGAIGCALTPNLDSLFAGLVVALIGGAGVLIVALAVWRAKQHVCTIMDHAAWVRAYKDLHAALDPVVHNVKTAREYLPPNAPESVWIIGHPPSEGKK